MTVMNAEIQNSASSCAPSLWLMKIRYEMGFDSANRDLGVMEPMGIAGKKRPMVQMGFVAQLLVVTLAQVGDHAEVLCGGICRATDAA